MSAGETPTTTAGCIRYWARQRPDHPAMRSPSGQYTYGELDRATNQLAQALRAAGVGPDDRVSYLDKNGPEQILLFFAAAKIGAVPTPVNYRLAPPEIAYIVADAAAKVFAIGDEFVATVRKVEADLGGARVVVMGRADGDWPSLAQFTAGSSDEDPGFEPGPGSTACQLYSSGTTGRPKGVVLTQSNVADGRDLYHQIMGMGPDSVSVVPMPLYHIGGSGWALAGFWQGATNVIVREIVPDQLIDTLVTEGVTHGFIVPAVIQFMLNVPGVRDRDWSRLQCVLYGASPISETVLAGAIETFGCRFVQAYGLTESTGTVIYLPADDHDLQGPNRHRLRACGIPIPGSEGRIVEPLTGEEMADGQVGEIWVKGPTVMAGYWHQPEQTAAAIQPGGWLRTGDAGYRDADGYFYIHDRVKDMIVSGGENVYPAEVENVIMSHPEVADVAVIGIPHERWGETPRAMVVRTAGSGLTEDGLLAYCRERLAGFKCPTSIQWIDELPRNPSGKVLKKDLRAPFWEGRTRLVG